MVYPSISIVAENPVAVVERTVAKKGTARRWPRPTSTSCTPTEGQEIAAKHDIRPRDPAVLKK